MPVSTCSESAANNLAVSEKTTRSVRFISALTVTLVALLGVASFVLSFEALWHFASESGALNTEHAWLFPVMVDGSICVFSISALRCSIVGEDSRWPMSLVIGSTIASLGFNCAHAPGGLMPALIAATPPLLLFLSFESLLRQVTSSLGGKHSSLSELLPRPKRRSHSRAVKATPAREAQAVEKALDEKKERARQLLREGTPKRQVARDLGLGIATVRRLSALTLTPPQS